MRSKSIIAAPLLLIALTACAPSPVTHSSRFEGARLPKADFDFLARKVGCVLQCRPRRRMQRKFGLRFPQ